jgi:hypothetical protein
MKPSFRCGFWSKFQYTIKGAKNQDGKGFLVKIPQRRGAGVGLLNQIRRAGFGQIDKNQIFSRRVK